jgi:DnaA family protein
MKQIPLAIGPEPLATFESYLPGPNAAALDHLMALQAGAAPVYLWGPSGSGKSHLLQALAGRCQAAGQTVGWFDPATPGPWPWHPDWSLVVLDGCEGLVAQQQQQAFALFVEATGAGVQWAAAGRLPPVDLALREDLGTRLAWGHVFALELLGEAESRAVLRRDADRRGIFLSDEVMDYLLARFPRDLSHLGQVLARLDRYGLARSRRITVPLVRDMLAEDALTEAQPP